MNKEGVMPPEIRKILEEMNSEYDNKIIDSLDLKEIWEKEPKKTKKWETIFRRLMATNGTDINLGYGIHLLHQDTIGTFGKHIDQYDGPFLPFPPSILENFSLSKDWDESFTNILDNTAHLRRLIDIRQLGCLTFPEPDQTEWPGKDFGIEKFEHSRYDHSFLTAIFTLVVMLTNQLEGKAITNEDILKGFISSAIHDSATVAGGDATKKIAPEQLDEEKLIIKILQSPEIKKLFEDNGFTDDDIEDIKNIISNYGLIGNLLDVADRISYTARDLQMVQPILERGDYLTEDSEEILRLSYQEPRIYDLMFDFKIEPEKNLVYCTNPKRLLHALKIRALMHNFIYLNPYSQIAEAAVVQPALSKMWQSQSEQISPDKMIGETDRYFERMLCKILGYKEYSPNLIQVIRETIRKKDIQVAVYPDLKSAEKDVCELTKKGRHIISVVDKTKGFKTATDIMVQTPDGIKPLKEAYPEEDKKIQEIANRVKSVRVYHSIEPIC